MSGIIESMVELLAPLGFFALVALIVYFAIQAHHKRNKMEHEERMLALEKGVDITMSPSHPKKIKHRNPYAWPFVLIASGLAIVAGVIIQGDFKEMIWGLVCLFIGAAMMLAHRYYMKEKKADSKPTEALEAFEPEIPEPEN